MMTIEHQRQKSYLFCATLSVLLVGLTTLVAVSSRSLWEIVCLVPGAYAIYYLLACLFSLRSRITTDEVTQRGDRSLAIAVLMTVCDDFDESAAMSFARLEYPAFRLFILDDSRSGLGQARARRWCQEHESVCVYVHRGGNVGFKAGNLNHADSVVPAEYELFFIVDSDEQIAPSFLTELVATYKAAGHPTFLQAVHRGRMQDVSGFSRVMAPSIWMEWRYHLPYRNRYGLQTVLGHGCLIDRRALREVGGHPEIVSEDLALTSVLAARGYRGVMAPRLVSTEAYPSSLRALQSRRFRWVAADWQLLLSRYYREFMKSCCSLPEKLDLSLREWRLPASSVYIAVLIMIGGMLMVGRVTGELFMGAAWRIEPSIGTVTLMLVGVSPLLPLLLPSESRFLERARAAFSVLFVGLSMATLQVAAGVSYLARRSIDFDVTNQEQAHGADGVPCRGATSHVLVWTVDMGSTVVLAAVGIAGPDLIVLTVALCCFLRRLAAHHRLTMFEQYVWVPGLLVVVASVAQLTLIGSVSIVGLGLICALAFLVV